MEITFDPEQLNNIKNSAEQCGMDVPSFIRGALFFFLKVTDTNTLQGRVAYSTAEVAKKLGLSTKTILRLVAQGKLSPLEDSKRRFVFSEKEVERYVASATGRSAEKMARPRRTKTSHTRRHN
jgi:excisionase family DNA binding protein